jgi:hypothetical protein
MPSVSGWALRRMRRRGARELDLRTRVRQPRAKAAPGCPIRAPQRRQAADQRFSARQPRRETGIQLGPVPAHVLTQKSAARRWCAQGRVAGLEAGTGGFAGHQVPPGVLITPGQGRRQDLGKRLVGLERGQEQGPDKVGMGLQREPGAANPPSRTYWAADAALSRACARSPVTSKAVSIR